MNAAYRRSQLAFYEKHHPAAGLPLLRAVSAAMQGASSFDSSDGDARPPDAMY